jgi:hypothetical protein
MKIAICEKNVAAIEKALESINGRSFAYCYTTAKEVAEVSLRAESRLGKLLSAKKNYQGAEFYSTSGSTVANCYKGVRNATKIKIMRGSKDWFLVSVSRVELWPNQHGTEEIIITEEQEKLALEKFSYLFCVKGKSGQRYDFTTSSGYGCYKYERVETLSTEEIV